jgi:hypothetical protein
MSSATKLGLKTNRTMTTQEFQLQLDAANSLLELNVLRTKTGASKFVAMIKEKVVKVASNEGFESFSCNLSTLSNLTTNTNTNSLSIIEIPSKNRTFRQYAGQKVNIYVNHKEGSKNTVVYGFIKAI